MPTPASPVPPAALGNPGTGPESGPEAGSGPGPVGSDGVSVESSHRESAGDPSTVADRAVVRLTDATFRDGVAELRWRLREQILAGVRVLVVDVSAVRQLSSTAVAALLGAHRTCRARGGGVIIRDPNRRTLDLLRRTGLWRVLRPEFTDGGRAARQPGPRGEGR